ncbi:MAG TPA: protein kinase [Acidisarcina sp.]
MNNLPAAGEQIRDYKILGRIGKGGMGVVFNALDLKLHRIVALKFLPGNLGYTSEDKRSLLQEARVISALDHPNICTIFGVEETEQTGDNPFEQEAPLFIVMAYYDGGTLADRIGAGPMLLPDVLDLLIGVASGLSAAHSRRIVHRDIKPSNILLTRESVVKIVDFGLAKIVNLNSNTQSLTNSGTLAYMAPEQIQGEQVDHRADIWAVGVLGAEMLSGVHPFKRDNLAAVAYGITYDPPRPVTEGPEKLQQIIYKCLSKDPALRYQSCEELLADLRPLRAQYPEGAGGANPAWEGETGEWKPASTQRRALRQSIRAASGERPAAVWRRLWWIPASLVALAALAVVLPSTRERLVGAVLSPTEKHIAVLPFDNVGGDPVNEALAGGLMDSMTGALSNLDSDQKSLWVVPSSVVRGQHVTDPAAALKALGANLVVKGSVSHFGRGVMLTANLINTRTLRQIGAASASSPDGDVASLQREVVVQLGRMLNVSVNHGELAGASGGSGPAGYDLYLEALSYMQRFDKPGNLDRAIGRLQTAVGQDSRFALAYATMGEAYRLKFEADHNDRWLQLALSNCEQAIRLNPLLPGAYVTLGDIHAVTGHPELASDEFQHALSLDDRNPAAISGLAWSYEQAGHLDQAEAEYRKAITLRPGDWYSNDRLALFYDRHGRYDEAIAQMKEAIQLTSDNRNAYYNLGAFYLEAGDPAHYPDAEAALKRSLELSPSYPAYGNLALLYLREKRYAEAAVIAQKALAINDRDVLPWSYSELAYRWLRQDSQAANALAHMKSLAEAAVKLNPEDAESQSWLGLALARQGLGSSALAHLQTAVAMAPSNQQVLVNSIEAYVMIGDESSAQRLIEQAKQSRISLADLDIDPSMGALLSTAK